MKYGMVFLAIVLGFFLMEPLAHFFDKMDWPLFQSGELAHATFIIAWPLLALLSFGLMKAVMLLWSKSSK